MRILLVEDSVLLATSLRQGLRRLGHGVDVVHDGRTGLSYARNNPYDLLVLDRMLPELDGLSLLRQLRSDGSKVPVLFLTALDEVDERVEGLNAGADDYLIKPFAFEEFEARVETLGRRRRESGATQLCIGPLRLDTSSREVHVGDAPLELPAREYALLCYLASRRGQVASRIEIEDHLYDEDTLPMSNAVASAVSHLRARLAQHDAGHLLRTRRGLGYVLDECRP